MSKDVNQMFNDRISRRELLKKGGLGAGLLMVPGLISACGGGTTTTIAGGAGLVTTGAETAGIIPIGCLTSFTGEMGAYGQDWSQAAQFAVDEINQAGGVLGKKLQLFTEDDRTNVEEGTKGARKLIGVDKVVGMTGMSSDIWSAIYPIAKDAKVMAASGAAGTMKMDNVPGDYKFRTCASDSFDGRVAATALLDQGFKEIALLYENGESYQSIGAAMKKEYEAKGGKIVAEVAIAPRQSTYAAELGKIAEANPKAVWMGAGQETGPTVLKDASQRGYKWQWMVSADLDIPEIFDLVGKDVMEGVYTEVGKADQSTEQYKAWAERLKISTKRSEVGAWMEHHYDAVVIMALAMIKGKAATGEAISQNYRDVASPPGEKVYTFADGAAALAAGKDINYEGVSGPVDEDENGNTVGSYEVSIGKAGKWEEVKFYPASTWL